MRSAKLGSAALSLGERVSRSGDFTSRSVTGEGSFPQFRLPSAATLSPRETAVNPTRPRCVSKRCVTSSAPRESVTCGFSLYPSSFTLYLTPDT